MARNKETSAFIDALLVGIAGGTIVGTMLVAPNAIHLLEKPLGLLGKTLSQRQKQRRLVLTRRYMKTQGLVRGDYSHGLEITKKAQKRIQRRRVVDLSITAPLSWEGEWRLILFDIPETKKTERTLFVLSLKNLGMQLLQQSVWVHPYSCKEEVYILAHFHGVSQWVTYITTNHIDNDQDLRLRFKSILR